MYRFNKPIVVTVMVKFNRNTELMKLRNFFLITKL